MKQLIFIDTSVNQLSNRVNGFVLGKNTIDIRDKTRTRDGMKYFAIAISYEEEDVNAN